MERKARQDSGGVSPARKGGAAAAFVAGLFAVMCSTSAMSGVAIDNKPLTVTNTVPGNLVLVPSVEWPTVVTHANNPGIGESGSPKGVGTYDPSAVYVGYFHPEVCYEYVYATSEPERHFRPARRNEARVHTCNSGTESGRWSGNFLNWAAMQSIDAFRLAMTGGYRVKDDALGNTWLEKAESDRYNNNYNPHRTVPLTGTDAARVKGAMPGAFTAIRMRIAGVHNQLWFVGTRQGDIGANDVISRGDGPQTGGSGNNRYAAIPYNPDHHALPNSASKVVINATGCGSTEPECVVTTGTNPVPRCPADYAFANSICTRSGFPDLAAASCPAGTAASGGNCTRSTGGRFYTHAEYGNDQIYAVSVRVQVCDGAGVDNRSMCRTYGSHRKPEGLIQANSKKSRYSVFSYQSSSSASDGAVMRARQKLVAPLSAGDRPYPDLPALARDYAGSNDGSGTPPAGVLPMDRPEWNPATGVLYDNPDAADAALTLASIRYSGVINYINRFGSMRTGARIPLKGNYTFPTAPNNAGSDNVSDLYYAALRYLRGMGGLSGASGNFLQSTAPNGETGSSADQYKYMRADGLPAIPLANWYGSSSTANWVDNKRPSGNGDYDPVLYQCQASVMLGIGDTATAYGSNNPASQGDGGVDGLTPGFNYTTYLDHIKDREGGGASKSNAIAALALWARVNDLRLDVPNPVAPNGSQDARRGQTVNTYWVDVVEQNDWKSNTTNQYYLAAKYGGFSVPSTAWDASGNAAIPGRSQFQNSTSAGRELWTSESSPTQGNFYRPNNLFFANSGQAMIDGLNAAFQKIADDISGSGGSFASNSTKLETGSRTYQAKYASNGWGGQLIASDVNVANGTLTPIWDASDWLGHAPGQPKVNTAAPTWNFTQRKVLYNDSGTLAKFITNWDDYANLTSPIVVTKPAGLSSVTNDQLRYLLGERLHERQSTSPGSKREFRNRRGMLGDIVNSQPVYVGRPNANLHRNDPTYAAFAAARASRTPVVYVGANDGMLHAFQAPDAADDTNAEYGGRELFAFMPTEAMGVLTQSNPATNRYPYWHPEYDHAYSVDGELTVADVKHGDTWKTVLVGTMGRGGKSVFALDVTDPAEPALLWEKGAADVPSLGNVLGRPLIAQVGEGDWRVFLGNGPNNDDDESALVMFDVISGDDTVIDTGATGSQGLSAVNVWDAHGATEDDVRDGLFDTVYAGDMGGNMWKFKLGAGTATLLFAAGDTQPITAAPLVASNPYSPPDTWLFFGTGQYLSMADINEAANGNVQSWYGVIDRGEEVEKSTLNQVAITAQDSVGRVIERAGAAGANGWYIDLQSPEEADGAIAARGERMVLPNFFQGMVLIGTTRFPDSTDPCAPAGKGFTMAIDPFTGGRLSNAFFDINQRDGVGDEGDYHNGDTDTPYSGIAYDSGPNNPIFLGEYMYTSLDDGSYSQVKTGAGAASIKRVSWRELMNEM